jgi:16S rRNA G966 N2-methylase RsmD
MYKIHSKLVFFLKKNVKKINILKNKINTLKKKKSVHAVQVNSAKKSKEFLLFNYSVSNAEKRWDLVNSMPPFFLTKQLQLRFK